jgi:hypothetical protein
MPQSVQRNWENKRNVSVGIADASAEISTYHIPNTKKKKEKKNL